MSVKMVDSTFVTIAFEAVNVTEHPLSHICPTESSECCANPGRICAFLAACDKEGILNVVVCVEVIVSPFGRRTDNGLAVDFLLEHLALSRRKCAVHPESKSAVDGDG
jgi:hypothetical protein